MVFWSNLAQHKWSQIGFKSTERLFREQYWAIKSLENSGADIVGYRATAPLSDGRVWLFVP